MACYGTVNKQDNFPEVNRRSFLKNTSLATVMAMMGGVELRADDAPKPAAPVEPALTKIPIGPTVKFGVIGLGARGRDVLKELALLPNTPVAAICDNYPSSMRRAGNNDAPKAQRFDDYQKLLACPDVQAVVIATPTPDHREMAIAALKAGKHVYCEAPLAHSVEDTRAIAVAARDSVKLVFQPGLQERSHPQRYFLLPFIRSGALGTVVMTRAQSHQNTSWFSASSNPEHEKALNWRLHQATSTGLMGEIGIHQIDAVSWFLRERPVAVTGFGSIMHWKEDGRDVADTVQGIFEYPDGANFVYDATLCNSFDKDYEMYYGTQSAVMVRDAKAWLFYEAGAQLGGWEVYARKDDFYTETGIALAANATKQTAIGTSATAAASPWTPLHYALEAFAANVGQRDIAVKDFVDNYGDSDLKALADNIKALKPYAHAADWQDGLTATVLGIKANESVVKKQKVPIEKELFDI
jgi:predicted dehydrogenase